MGSDLLKEASVLFRAGEYGKALLVFRQIPGPNGLYGQAACLFKLQHYEESRAVCEHCLSTQADFEKGKALLSVLNKMGPRAPRQDFVSSESVPLEKIERSASAESLALSAKDTNTGTDGAKSKQIRQGKGAPQKNGYHEINKASNIKIPLGCRITGWVALFLCSLTTLLMALMPSFFGARLESLPESQRLLVFVLSLGYYGFVSLSAVLLLRGYRFGLWSCVVFFWLSVFGGLTETARLALVYKGLPPYASYNLSSFIVFWAQLTFTVFFVLLCTFLALYLTSQRWAFGAISERR